MIGDLNHTPLPGTPSTPSRMVRAVLLTTPAAAHPTCCGSIYRLPAQSTLMTLKCAGAMMKQPAMKMLEWFCYNRMFSELSKLFNTATVGIVFAVVS